MPDPMRRLWHPVALASAVGATPISVTLLDEPLVLWRARGEVVVFQDLCLHRGAALSLGRVDGDEIVCAYHGWRYAADGRCTKIPSIPSDRGIPSRAKAFPCRVVERYGLIWVALDEPVYPVPEMPLFDDGAFHPYLVGPARWNIGAARSVENFMDTAHLAWVHAGYLGSPDRPENRQSAVEMIDEHTLRFYTSAETRNRVDPTKMEPTQMEFTLIMPFSVHIVYTFENGGTLAMLFLTSPTGERSCTRFGVLARNWALDQSDDTFRSFNEMIWEQDRPVVESQRPEALPVDLTEELHLKGPDDPSLIYRRWLKAWEEDGPRKASQ